MLKDWNKCLICADSKDVIARIPDNSIDFILTDPPYNIGQHSTGNIPLPGRSAMNNDVADWDQIDFNPEEWADEFIRILKPYGNLFIFTSYNQIGRWYNCLDRKFDTTNFMIWHKTNPAPKIFKAGFLNSCEMIFTCWNKGHVWNFISQAEMHNFFESPICMRPERLSNPKHPAQKPIALLKKLITIASNPGAVVFDPFMGVGSTGVAACELGRKFIGVEINDTYFRAAKQRVEAVKQLKETDVAITSEPLAIYGNRDINPVSLQELHYKHYKSKHTVLPEKEVTNSTSTKKGAGLKPIIKWAGGKEKELKYIIENLPEDINNYYEPFVGGGAVFMNITAKRYIINDLSDELITLYKLIQNKDKRFFTLVSQINDSWTNASAFAENHKSLIAGYIEYREGLKDYDILTQDVKSFCSENKDEIISILTPGFLFDSTLLIEEVKKNLLRKMKRMKVLEHTKHLLPEQDLYDNIETAIKSALYMYYRTLYNQRSEDVILHCALFYFIRNYCYSGMFRYNDNGEFNVPYGGIAYNSKSLQKQIEYYLSSSLQRHISEAYIYNLDFEEFLRHSNPDENDFVFLDPPYDSEFSTYARNEFTRDDQTRLARYMIEECKAKWMLIIKNTDFIYSLYNKPGINIRSFDKEYVVSFMNRNDKKVTHLLITNY